MVNCANPMSHFSIERGYHDRKNNQSMRKAQPHESIFLLMKPTRTGPPAENSARAGLLPSTFEALFNEHWAHVYRVLLRLVGDPAEAEDLALETFLRLYQRQPASPNGAGEFNFGGWLHRVATNLGLHSIRSFKRREYYELTVGKSALDESPENRPTEILEGEEQRRNARSILASMPVRQAEILILRYSGASYKEIAAAVGIKSSSIGPLLLRAEREFEKRYRALLQEEP
jgi:RNA polymerase sigma factor (sigma-70 family)